MATQITAHRPCGVEAAPDPMEGVADLLDRVAGSSLAQWTMGIAPESLAAAYADWAVHFARSPGRSLLLLAKGVRKAQRLSDYATRQWIDAAVRDCPGVSPHHEAVLRFGLRQMLDLISPANFPATNPVVQRRMVETGGKCLFDGAKLWAEDWQRLVRREPPDTGSDFEVGRNLAVTPGKVVFRNELIELIQYTPTTERVRAEPILIVPAWIMKYYILDLSPDNSLIRYLVDQGFTVFAISWRNPGPEMRDTGMEDYRRDGVMRAMDAVSAITGAESIHACGYCLGGTLLGCTLAYLSSKGKADRIASATHFTTMLDFSDPGELGVFIDDDSLAYLEEQMNKRGYLDGSEMASTFNMLRANDLIWSFVVNNYLLGKDPFPFDLLYWNSDSTRMPAAMHSFYLRKMYQENLVREPRGISLDGVPIDLSTVKTPSYFISAREDHIAPWKSTFIGSQLYSGPVKFSLSASGHIAGVVNPPVARKYCFWTYNRKVKDPDAWLAGLSLDDFAKNALWAGWVGRCAPRGG
ncbi:MAG: alpha/beta fold hydrolase [Novosphingobium sp.]